MPIPPIPPDGTLIVGATAPQVYLIESGQRRWVPDPITFESMGFDWNAIQQFSDVEVNLVPLGSPLPPINRVQTPQDVNTNLGAGHFMTTSATLLSDGRLTAFTRTQSVTWFGGFTGGVKVVMSNANDIVIGTSSQHTFGVDGRWIGVSDRMDRWTENIDQAIASQTARLGVIHAWAPRVNIEEMVSVAIQIGLTIWQLIDQANQEDGSGAGA